MTGEHHRNLQGGPVRATVFGVSDGLVTIGSLIWVSPVPPPLRAESA